MAHIPESCQSSQQCTFIELTSYVYPLLAESTYSAVETLIEEAITVARERAGDRRHQLVSIHKSKVAAILQYLSTSLWIGIEFPRSISILMPTHTHVLAEWDRVMTDYQDPIQRNHSPLAYPGPITGVNLRSLPPEITGPNKRSLCFC